MPELHDMKSVFEQFQDKAWPFKFKGTLWVSHLAGGTPTDERVAEGHIRSKLEASDDIIREQVAKTMVERNVGADEAARLVGDARHLNGFKRDDNLGLFIEGRQLKAALKEAASVAVASEKLKGRGWGSTNKSLLNFLAEHVVVDNERLYLGKDDPNNPGQIVPVFTHDEILQRFVHTWRGTGIQYEEIVNEVYLSFTILTDYDFTEEDWAMIWLTGQEQGIGASRSQSLGRYRIIAWDRIPTGGRGGRVTGQSESPKRGRKPAAK